MDLMNWVAGGAAVGLLASCWGYLKVFVWKFTSLLIQRVEVDTATYWTLIEYAVVSGKINNIRDRVYQSSEVFNWTRNKREVVGYENYVVPNLFVWWHKSPSFITFSRPKTDKLPEASELAPAGSHVGGVLYFIRGTLDLDRLLQSAIESLNTYELERRTTEGDDRFFVADVPNAANRGVNLKPDWYYARRNRFLGLTVKDLVRPRRSGSELDALVFPDETHAAVAEIKRWHRSKDWYEKLDLAWKRGWLLYGPPGTGKTALIRAIAQDLGIPVYIYNLGLLDIRAFTEAWQGMLKCTPCVALFEDFDTVFDGRKNISPAAARDHGLGRLLASARQQGATAVDGESGRSSSFLDSPVTFDVFLNVLDGVVPNDGVFTIITTNDVNKIDPALGRPNADTGTISTRPGRIDRAIELTYLTNANKKKLAKKILVDYPAKAEEVCREVDRHPELEETPAQFQDKCTQIALACFWGSDTPLEERNGCHTLKLPHAV